MVVNGIYTYFGGKGKKVDYFVFGLVRDNKTVFIGRGDKTVDLQKIMRDHHADGILYIAKNLTDLESLSLEYQLIYDVLPDDNKDHSAYSGSSPWTHSEILYKKFGIKPLSGR